MSLIKNNFIKRNKIFYIILILIFSFSINYYYGYLGINPLDNFFVFNSGYDILNGHYPFKDYWTITGPLVFFIQAFLFKIFGVSWSVYILQASIFNFIISISTFYILNKFNLNKNYCFLYALLVSIIAYPSSGTPYVDHQSTYLCILAIFAFVLSIKTKSNFSWYLTSFFLGMAFFTKQAPTGYFAIIIFFFASLYFYFNFDIKKISIFFLGLASIIFIFIFILFIAKVPLLSFYQQYILYPFSIGESRMEFLFPLEFKRIILRFKLIHLSLLILLIINFKEIKKNIKYIKSNDFIITLSLVCSAFALILHQLMTINGMFIFFIIPILVGFSHIYYLKYFKSKNFIVYFLITLSVASTFNYWAKYINKRDFLDLSKLNVVNAVDAEILDSKLKGLKWITVNYGENPQEEIVLLKEAIDIIKNDKKNKTIVTDYQFISVILSLYDNSPNAYWFKHHVYPEKGHKYFKIYKNFFIEKIKENNIQIIYTVKPLWGDDNVLKSILSDDCVMKKNITTILDSHLILSCDELTN